MPGTAGRSCHEAKRPPRGAAFLLWNDAGRLFRGRQWHRLGRLFGGLALALFKDERIALDGNLAQLVHLCAGAGRDQPADDDILLETVERIRLAVDGGFGEHARGLLEGGRRDERAGLQRRLGDAEQNRVGDGRLLAFRDHRGVDLIELDLVELLALDQVGLTRLVDLHLLQHLADDHLDVLVVDVDALQPVDLLALVDQIGGEILDALDRKDVVRRGVALDDEVALLDDVAILQMDVLALRDQVLLRLLVAVVGLDGDAPLVLVVAAEAHRARYLGDDRGFLGPPCLEQLRHPRQAAGDVARLGALGRDTRDDVARLDVGPGIDRDDRIDGELVARLAAAAELRHLAVLALDHDCRTQVLAAAGGAPVDDHALGDAGGFIQRLQHRLILDQILEGDRTLDLGQHRAGVGIPLGDALATLDLVAIVDAHARAVLDAVHGPLGAALVDHLDGHVANHGDQFAVAVAHDVLVVDLDHAVEVRLDERLLGDLRRAADVERTHRELRARLADRLGGDDAHRLAHVDRRAAGEIAPIALAAHAGRGLAGEHRTDAHLLDPRLIDRLDLRLAQEGVLLHHDLVAGGIAH